MLFPILYICATWFSLPKHLPLLLFYHQVIRYADMISLVMTSRDTNAQELYPPVLSIHYSEVRTPVDVSLHTRLVLLLLVTHKDHIK
jgi:hypothetical protein